MNYGSRVQESSDRALIKVLLSTFIVPAITDDKYNFTSKEIYLYPTDGVIEPYLIQLPALDSPEVLGLHDNARVWFQQKEVKNLIQTTQFIENKLQRNTANLLTIVDGTSLFFLLLC
jgi:dynein heavy chain